MVIQTFKTMCDGCNEEVTYKIGDMTGDNEIIIEFISDMEFECSCGTTTFINIEKSTM